MLPTNLSYPGLAVVAVLPTDPGPVNARVLDASADSDRLAAALRSAVNAPPWVERGLGISPPIFLCGAVPPALEELAVRSHATAGADLGHGALSLITTAAVADASTHAEIDLESKLEWATTTLGAWAAAFFPMATLTPRERAILGLRLLDVSRDDMTRLLGCPSKERLNRAIGRLLHRVDKRDLEVAVGPLVRRFAQRSQALEGRTYTTVRPSRRHDLLATPPGGRARPPER